ncbi:2-hydroxyacyl-CoA dehydratase [Candidatus Thorarchaeota archaeon]|nr:MAG: 2-hydroxyacyl-CoA dehydratase [Candidatus Thorarchaeota archaeon]
MTHGEVIEYSAQLVGSQKDTEEDVMGYIYPHCPVEILAAHGFTASLLKAVPEIKGGFESSLQTFACSLTRNLFSQRQNGTLPPLDGILFPGNTCDSLQNVGDVWKKRFPEDKVFRLTYPAIIDRNAAIEFLSSELRLLSNKLEIRYGRALSETKLSDAISLWNQFRNMTQFAYAARILNPTVVSYSTLSRRARNFLSHPSLRNLDPLRKLVTKIEREMDLEAVKRLQNGLLKERLSGLDFTFDDSKTRLLVAGGMVEPAAISELLEPSQKLQDVDIVLDLLSYGFKTVFTPPIHEENLFDSTAKSMLHSPLEPTQEGLTRRMEMLKEYLTQLKIDGIVVCEQSFCDPDQFEAPSMIRVARKLSIPATRLPLDPELSDRSRIEGRLQTLVESIHGGK